jgi:predicted nicotinamide N-methyase
LWFAELVLAEWMASTAPVCRDKQRQIVLELGCGVAPVAALCSLSMGYDVVLTDLASVLPYAQRNVELNCQQLVKIRNQPVSLSRNDLDLLPLDWTEPLPSRILDLCPLITFVICSDCLFQNKMHEPLATTLASLFRYGKSGMKAIVVFQKRSEEDLLFFTEVLPRAGLRSEQQDIRALLSEMPMPSNDTTAAVSQVSDMHKHMLLFSVMAKAHA